MKNFAICEKGQKSPREREVVFQSSQFTEIGWQELPVATPTPSWESDSGKSGVENSLFLSIKSNVFPSKIFSQRPPQEN